MNASISEKFKIKNYIEQAHLDPPVLGREGGQHGQQHRLHQDKGHHREAREADATEGPVSSPSYRLARTAENKLEIILESCSNHYLLPSLPLEQQITTIHHHPPTTM